MVPERRVDLDVSHGKILPFFRTSFYGDIIKLVIKIEVNIEKNRK